jgi:hypothetical protein
MTATRVWLSAATRSARARHFARWNAIGAISLSLLGNAAWHLVAAKVLTISWPIVVVVVGAIPPAVLGLLSHLAVLRGQNGQDEASPDSAEPDDRQDNPALAILAAARRADEAYRREHGTDITRDALRRELRTSTAKASALLRELRHSPPDNSGANRPLLFLRFTQNVKRVTIGNKEVIKRRKQ